jgi:zinc transport system ATP-binding protein
MIEIKNLNYTLDKNIVLKNINLSIKKQDFIVFIGPNGGGKTTLLKLILGLLSKHKGTIKYDKSLKFGYVPQNNNINNSLPISVLSFIKLGIYKNIFYRLKTNAKQINQKAIKALNKVGLSAKINAKISTLSGGQLQRAMIARAILDNPDVLILDEPTSNIDQKGVSEIFALLDTLNKQKCTILLVNHDIRSTFAYAHKVAHIDKVLTIHKNNIKNLLNVSQTHFCEVELVKLLQLSHNNNCNNTNKKKFANKDGL